MNKKKVLIVMFITSLGISFAATSAWADSKHRYRREGIAIGVGAAIVGSALINHHGFGSYHDRGYGRPCGHRHHHWRRHHPKHRCLYQLGCHGYWKSCHPGRHGHWKSRHPGRHGHWKSRHPGRHGHPSRHGPDRGGRHRSDHSGRNAHYR